MNSRAFTLSLVIALIAMFMTYSYIEGEKSSLVNKYGKNVPVVVASTDIKELELIDDRKVTVITVPNNYKSPNAFSNKADVFNTVATVPIKQGEQITAPRVTYPGAKTGLSRQVTIGKRALSVMVSQDTAVSKLIRPGDRVDIIALINYAGGKIEKMKVKTVLQDVSVLATGLKVTNNIPLIGFKTDDEIKKMNLATYENFNTVTMELSPHEVEKMIFLVKSGSGIYLSLRNNDDSKKELLGGTKIFDVLGEDAAEAKLYFQEQAERVRQRQGQ
jgi:pilus assembly protein CpaB